MAYLDLTGLGYFKDELVSDTLSQSGRAADAKAAGEAIYDSLPTDTASGSIASFPDGASNVPVETLTISLEPVQSGSGTPSPDNVRPITGHTQCEVWRSGKNLLDPSTASALGQTVWFCEPDGFLFKGGVTYTLSVSNIDDVSSISIYTTDKTTQLAYSSGSSRQAVTYTPTEDTYGLPRLYRSTAITQAIVDGTMIEAGGSRTAFEPYQGTSISIPLGQTVYGGTVDAVQGVCTVDRAMVDLGDLSWTYDSSSFPSWAFFYTNDLANVKKPIWDGLVCSNYPLTSSMYARTEDFVMNGTGYRGGRPINIRDSRYTDAATFKTAMSGVQLVYELATPIEIQLTAHELVTLLGQNNIWSDSGDVSVTYRADIQRYITKVISEALA